MGLFIRVYELLASPGELGGNDYMLSSVDGFLMNYLLSSVDQEFLNHLKSSVDGPIYELLASPVESEWR